MSSLTTEQLAVLEHPDIISFVTSGFLKEKISDFIDENNLTDSNYSQNLKGELLKKIHDQMRSYVEDGIIEKISLLRATHVNYDNIKSWVDDILKQGGETRQSIKAIDHWDICISIMINLITIKIVEVILDVS